MITSEINFIKKHVSVIMSKKFVYYSYHVLECEYEYKVLMSVVR